MVNQNKYLTREEIDRDINEYIEKNADELIMELKKNWEIKVNDGNLCIK